MPNRSLFAVFALSAALLAALGGYLLAQWRAGQPVEQSEAEALVDMSQSNIENLQRKLESDIAGRPRSPTEERLSSPLGQALFRKCSEWVEFHGNQPGEEARAYRDEACREYRDYVNDGTLPAGRPDPS